MKQDDIIPINWFLKKNLHQMYYFWSNIDISMSIILIFSEIISNLLKLGHHVFQDQRLVHASS